MSERIQMARHFMLASLEVRNWETKTKRSHPTTDALLYVYNSDHPVVYSTNGQDGMENIFPTRGITPNFSARNCNKPPVNFTFGIPKQICFTECGETRLALAALEQIFTRTVLPQSDDLVTQGISLCSICWNFLRKVTSS
jgi:hypothetical protein